MTLKIERVSLAQNSRDNRQVRFAEFVDTIKQLKPGESFVYPHKVQTTHRLAVTIAARLLEREYVVRQEKGGIRIGRIS
jgi:hypothetical protein